VFAATLFSMMFSIMQTESFIRDSDARMSIKYQIEGAFFSLIMFQAKKKLINLHKE
jgi:hypothetical protein